MWASSISPATNRRSRSEGVSAAWRSSRTRTAAGSAGVLKKVGVESNSRKRAPSVPRRRARRSGRSVLSSGNICSDVRGAAPELALEGLAVPVPDVRAQGLDPRPVRGRPPRFPTPAPQDLRAAPNRPRRRARRQAGSCRSRLPPDEEQPPSARQGLGQPGLQLLQLGPASDERTRGSGVRGLARSG